MCTECSKTIVTEQEQRCKIMCTECSKTIVTEEEQRCKIMCTESSKYYSNRTRAEM